MHPRAIAQRSANATNRTRIAADRIAESLGIAPLDVHHSAKGGAEVAQLHLREALAEYLERIADATSPKRESGPKARKSAAVTATEGETDGSDPIPEAVPEVARLD